MEKKVEYHKDGKTIEREYFVDDKNQKQDKQITYYPDGSIKSETVYKDGKPTGLSLFYNEMHVVIRKTNHKEDGTQEIESYYPNGQLEYKEVRDVNGISNGLSQHYNKEGQLAHEATYQNGLKIGVEKFYINGNLDKKTVYKEHEEIETEETYHSNGKLSGKRVYQNNCLILEERYNTDGVLESKEYKENELEIKEAYDHEQLKSKEVLSSDGKKVVESYLKGQLFEKYTEQNYKKNGHYQTYTSGKLFEEGDYKNGLKDGIIKMYNPNGDVRDEITYNQGVIDNWIYYVDKKPMYKTSYRNGLPEKIEYFDKDLEVSELPKRPKDGAYQLKRTDGSVWEEGIAKNGFHIPTKKYHPNGQLQLKIEYSDNGQKVLEETYSITGELVGKNVYENNLPVLQERYKNGKLFSKEYKENDLDVYEFYPRGELGSKTILYPDGKRMRESYHNGKLWIKAEERNYKKDGLFQSYSILDGSLEREGTYKNGKEVGVWKEYRSDGTLSRQITYKDGLKEIEESYMMGHIREKIFYKNGLKEKVEKYKLDGTLSTVTTV
ncbi:MAG: hypothetical protein E7021_02455 [Alphaproteobacteria bacterium]|nr:hypothetical protein [Alphaproteobacteria bacterium]